MLLGTLLAFAVSSVAAPYTQAITSEQRRLFRQRVLYVDYFDQAVCPIASTNAAQPGTNTNIDYKGDPILTDAQLQAIQKNQPVYQQAAQKVDIPWQMLAVVHLREFGLKVANPANGQGIYQFVTKMGGPYPTGPVSEAEFLRQTILAAEFLKDKAKLNYPANRDLTANATPEAVKDTFFGYNGRAGVYVRQAVSLGYSNNQGYEGSPYVMNIADAKRDPEVNKTTWGQIKTDFGGLSYPANGDYGAFVVYGALAGITSGGGCSSTTVGPVRDKVVALARQELELWKSGQLRPGSGYLKYSHNIHTDWCAYFVSWIFNEAGYPVAKAANGAEGSVQVLWDSLGDGALTEHPADGSYTPVPGDIVIQKNGVSHTQIVVAVEGTGRDARVTIIGGNQAGTNGFETSKVTSYTYDVTGGGLNSAYLSPKSN
jgi:hypothetical protein